MRRVTDRTASLGGVHATYPTRVAGDSRGRLVRAILTGTDEQQAGSGGGKGGSSYHMASFDYAYNCVAAMEWLFQQGK